MAGKGVSGSQKIVGIVGSVYIDVLFVGTQSRGDPYDISDSNVVTLEQDKGAQDISHHVDPPWDIQRRKRGLVELYDNF